MRLFEHNLFCMRDRGGILVVKRRDKAESPTADGKGAYKRGC